MFFNNICITDIRPGFLKSKRCVTAVKWFAKQPKYLHEVPVTNTKADFSQK